MLAVSQLFVRHKMKMAKKVLVNILLLHMLHVHEYYPVQDFMLQLP